MERRLVAVLIADVVGYGRLSRIDEEGTRARFQNDLHELFEPRIAAHHGRLIKTMGDGLLVEFRSVVDALRCAVEVQRQKAERNAATSAEQRLDFRIGINLGDVLVEGDDIHGDGVNIADRVQTLSQPGGIAISGTTYDHVKEKLPLGFVSLGAQQVKSISEPVRIYQVVLDPGAPARKAREWWTGDRKWRFPLAAAALAAMLAVSGAWLIPKPVATVGALIPARKTPSLVVLPLTNLGNDSEQGYLAEGLTDDLTTDLARLPGLFVVSRNAALSYKGKTVSPREIAADLDISYILEGSIRRTGEDLRINAHLIDAQTGGHLWAERFDVGWNDIFAVQKQVTERVATALQLTVDTGGGGKPGGTNLPAAYDAYLQGLHYADRQAAADQAKAASLFQEAVRLDRDFGQAWAMLAWLYWNNSGNPAVEEALKTASFEMLPKARDFLKEAERKPSSLYYSLLSELLVYESKWDDAIAAARRGIELDPSDPASYERLSLALSFSGRGEEAERPIGTALRVNPRWTDSLRFALALAKFVQGRFGDAAGALEELDSPANWHRPLWIAAEAQSGRQDSARRMVARPLARGADRITLLHALKDFPFENATDRDRLLEGLRKAGVPGAPFGFDWNAPERLSGKEIEALVFGHQTLGVLVETGDAYTRTTEPDGTMSVTNGPWSDQGFSRMEGDMICTWVTTRGRYCSTIFRNPTGTFEAKNQYIWINHSNRFEFSVVK